MVRPCGIIVSLSELFHAESLSQVYGLLHTFLRVNPSASDRLGMCAIFVYKYIGIKNYFIIILSQSVFVMMMPVI